MRHFRGSRGSRNRSMRPVIQSYKKVLLFINAGIAAGFNSHIVATGTDSVAAGQTGVTDAAVPTGSIIKYIEAQIAISNPSSITCFINCTLQYILGGQSFIDPIAVGGNVQRNQVLHMDMYSVGVDQNSNHKFKFKIPKQFQRLREGMSWAIVINNTASMIRNYQMIYKFYR